MTALVTSCWLPSDHSSNTVCPGRRAARTPSLLVVCLSLCHIAVRAHYSHVMLTHTHTHTHTHTACLTCSPSPSGDRCGAAVSGLVVEVHVGPLHAADLQRSLQRSVRPHRHRRRHRAVRTVRLLRHLQGAALDAEAGLVLLLNQLLFLLRCSAVFDL